MADDTAQLSELLTKVTALLTRQDAVITANSDFYTGWLTDPESFNASGGKTGDLGFYPLALGGGATVYFPCLARVQAMGGSSGGGGGGTTPAPSFTTQPSISPTSGIAAPAFTTQPSISPSSGAAE